MNTLKNFRNTLCLALAFYRQHINLSKYELHIIKNSKSEFLMWKKQFYKILSSILYFKSNTCFFFGNIHSQFNCLVRVAQKVSHPCKKTVNKYQLLFSPITHPFKPRAILGTNAYINTHLTFY